MLSASTWMKAILLQELEHAPYQVSGLLSHVCVCLPSRLCESSHGLGSLAGCDWWAWTRQPALSSSSAGSSPTLPQASMSYPAHCELWLSSTALMVEQQLVSNMLRCSRRPSPSEGEDLWCGEIAQGQDHTFLKTWFDVSSQTSSSDELIPLDWEHVPLNGTWHDVTLLPSLNCYNFILDFIL